MCMFQVFKKNLKMNKAYIQNLEKSILPVAVHYSHTLPWNIFIKILQEYYLCINVRIHLTPHSFYVSDPLCHMYIVESYNIPSSLILEHIQPYEIFEMFHVTCSTGTETKLLKDDEKKKNTFAHSFSLHSLWYWLTCKVQTCYLNYTLKVNCKNK